VKWENSPEITKVKFLLTANQGLYQQIVTVNRADGDGDATLSVPPRGDAILRIDALAAGGDMLNGLEISQPGSDTTIRVGGTPTHAEIFRHVDEAPVNGSTVVLPIHIGGNFAPRPLDANGDIVLLPIGAMTYSFTNAPVVDFQAPYVIGGQIPGTTQATVRYQGSDMGSFGILIPPQ
jgi:hypothetical protein